MVIGSEASVDMWQKMQFHVAVSICQLPKGKPTRIKKLLGLTIILIAVLQNMLHMQESRHRPSYPMHVLYACLQHLLARKMLTDASSCHV